MLFVKKNVICEKKMLFVKKNVICKKKYIFLGEWYQT